MEQIKSIILNYKEYKITESALKQLTVFLDYVKNNAETGEKYTEHEIQISVLLDMELEQKQSSVLTLEIINETINVMKENQKISYKKQFYSNERFKKKSQRKTYKKRNPLRRDSSNGILGGVCAGIARKLGIDPVIIRLLFVVLALFRGLFIPVYIILWIVMPSDEMNSGYNNTIRV